MRRPRGEQVSSGSRRMSRVTAGLGPPALRDDAVVSSGSRRMSRVTGLREHETRGRHVSSGSRRMSRVTGEAQRHQEAECFKWLAPDVTRDRLIEKLPAELRVSSGSRRMSRVTITSAEARGPRSFKWLAPDVTRDSGRQASQASLQRVSSGSRRMSRVTAPELSRQSAHLFQVARAGCHA